MTIRFLTILLTLLCFFSKSQNFNCEDFNQNVEGNLRTTIDFVTEDYFNSLLKDSIKIYKKTDKGLDSLKKEFDKKYYGKITRHCINSKVYLNGKTESYSQCNEKDIITLVGKAENYYIFNLKAFEIDNYMLFNTTNETIYFFNSLPTVLDNGNTLITMKFNSAYSHGINMYQLEDENLKNFNIEFSRQYLPEKTYIIKDWANRIKILLSLIRYDLKEVSNTFKDGRKYEYDKAKFCRKFLVISK